MKRYFFLLFSSLIFSCSPENSGPSLTIQSYTAEIGDVITLSGTNLSQVETVRIFSPDHNVPSAIIYDKPGTLLQKYYFESQSDTEIQFVLPELYAETYIIQAGEEQIPLQVKGFIPLFQVYPFELEEIMGLKVINDQEALGASRVNIPTRNLHLFKNGFYETQKISSDVQFFDVLQNGDTWYAKSTDFELYQIYYKSSSNSSYSFLTSFNTRDLDQLYVNPHMVLVTPEKQVYIFTQNGIFIKENSTLKKAAELYAGLEESVKEEKNVFDLQLTSQGNIQGKVILNPDNYYSDYEYVLLNLNPKNYTFNISEKFNSEPIGLKYKNTTGYFILPRERKMFKSIDSGLNWSEFYDFPSIDGELRSATIEVVDENTVLLFLHTSVGRALPYTTVYITSDSGNSWQVKKRFNSPTQKDLFLYQSDFGKQSGLAYFTDFTRRQLWKYVH